MPKIPIHLLDVYKERRELTKELHSIGAFIRGSVVELRHSCGKKNCKRCQSGEKHAANYLSLSVSGKTKIIYLSKKNKTKAKRWVSNYRKLLEIAEKISWLNVQILTARLKVFPCP